MKRMRPVHWRWRPRCYNCNFWRASTGSSESSHFRVARRVCHDHTSRWPRKYRPHMRGGRAFLNPTSIWRRWFATFTSPSSSPHILLLLWRFSLLGPYFDTLYPNPLNSINSQKNQHQICLLSPHPFTTAATVASSTAAVVVVDPSSPSPP